MVNKDIAKKIKHIEIYTKRLLSGTLVGDSRSAVKGTGLEFDQIREYQMGDDVRFIDWNACARSGKLLVKQYFEERSRTIVLAVDVSSSSFFSSAHQLKSDVIAQLASVLALVADYGKDYVSLVTFSDEVEIFIPPNRGRNHVRTVMKALFEQKHKNKTTRISAVLKHLAKMKRKDSIVFLISDFIDQDFEKPLGVVAKMYDLVAIRCLDTNEQTFPAVGFVTIEDAETGEQQVVDAREALDSFLKKRLLEQNSLFRKYDVDHLDVSCQRPFIGDIIRFFSRRMRY